MDTEEIRRQVLSRAGGLASPSPEDLAAYSAYLDRSEIADYLHSCLPNIGYEASGVRVASLEILNEENIGEMVPGSVVFPHGFLVIATSIGGNAICVDRESGAVYWIEPAPFYGDGTLGFVDDATGEWVETSVTADAIRRASRKLSDDFSGFLERLLSDELENELESLD